LHLAPLSPIFKNEKKMNEMVFVHVNELVYTDVIVRLGENLLDVLKTTALPAVNAKRNLEGRSEVHINVSALKFLSIPPSFGHTLTYEDIELLPLSKVFKRTSGTALRYVVIKSMKPSKYLRPTSLTGFIPTNLDSQSFFVLKYAYLFSNQSLWAMLPNFWLLSLPLRYMLV